MKQRMLGQSKVSAVGMGCMGFSTGYGEIPSEDESIRLIRLAHELGRTLFDTAEVFELVKKFAAEKNATPAQISLAWVMRREFVVPIPGMRRDERIKENLGAAEVVLSADEYEQLTAELDKLKVYGNRTDENIAKLGALERNKLFGSSGVPVKGLDK
ncbi:MAG: aldo/keto reductase [Selenomonadaceae bacterium]|nr:aldo/keto reductase [Selenomonadaceae bacterium]